MFIRDMIESEGVHIDLKVGPLAGRKLVSLNRDITLGYGAPDPCRAPYSTFERTIDTETLRANREPVCAQALKQIVELFPNNRISIETLLKMVEW